MVRTNTEPTFRRVDQPGKKVAKFWVSMGVSKAMAYAPEEYVDEIGVQCNYMDGDFHS